MGCLYPKRWADVFKQLKMREKKPLNHYVRQVPCPVISSVARNLRLSRRAYGTC
jgi:hypothetical protein